LSLPCEARPGDHYCLSLAHPPSGGTIPVNTEFAVLEVAAGSPGSLLLHPGSDAVLTLL
jgi:hypothetical protein